MSIVLPSPSVPHPQGAPKPLVKAYRLWQTGQQCAGREQWPQAARAFDDACALTSDAAYGLAAVHALIKAGRPADAVVRARHVRRDHPGLLLAYTLESHAWLEQGRPDEAVACLQALPTGVQRDLAYHTSLALALQRSSRHAEAVAAFFEALALNMTDGKLHFHLGMSFKDLGMKAEAAECLRTAVTLGVQASTLSAHGQLWFMEREACRWAEAEHEGAIVQRELLALPDGPCEVSAFTHAVLSDDPQQVKKAVRHYALHAARWARPLPLRKPQAHAGRLRVGYLSADFHTHATSQLLVQALECHDRGRFEVHLFSSGPDDRSPMRERMVLAGEHFVELRGQKPEQMARTIRDHRIDLLVDLKGATFDTLLPVMAHRPAPVQASWLGFPGSTGAPYIDYLIGDPVVTPLVDAADFAEKIAQLPHCYQPNDAHREHPPADPRERWGVPEDALLLCAFHQSYKISPQVFDAWCGLLHELPQARLWLLHWNTNVEQALVAEAQRRGIGADRLLFAPVVPLAQHLSRLACADLYLDTWPCNAHTTASEALWMGVPVLTLKGRTFAQRVAASILSTAGLPDLICGDVQSYVQRAVALGRDVPARQALRQRIDHQRMVTPLFDGARMARELEALYGRMWQRAVDGLPPDHLAAQS